MKVDAVVPEKRLVVSWWLKEDEGQNVFAIAPN